MATKSACERSYKQHTIEVTWALTMVSRFTPILLALDGIHIYVYMSDKYIALILTIKFEVLYVGMITIYKCDHFNS